MLRARARKALATFHYILHPIKSSENLLESSHKMKQIFTIKRVLTVAAGAILGYAYYYFIGCNSGQCPITGSPINSTLYGAFMGVILALPTKKNEKKEK